MEILNWKKCWIVFLLMLFPLARLEATPDLGLPDGMLSSWSFSDTTNWLNDSDYSPSSFTNLNWLEINGVNCLVMDSTNASRLQFNVVEADSHTNLMVDQGSIFMWYSGNWVGTNEGGMGPGQAGRLIEIGAPGSAWWSYCFDASGNIFFCGQNGGSPVTYLTSPIAWTTNNGGWSHLALTYSSTNSALYVNGALVASGAGVTAPPDTNALSKGFTIGSDTNGTLQALGMIADVITYDHPISADEVSANYLLYSLLNGPVSLSGITSGAFTNSISPFNAVTGSGSLTASGTNAAACVLSTNIWFTNMVAKTLTNGTQVTFLIQGGADGVLYDVFANNMAAASSDTNRPWSWMGQAYHCVTNSLTITNQPNFSAFLVLGKDQDSDGDGLTDAYELLVSKTDPHNWDTDHDGMSDGMEVQFGTNPLVDETILTASRFNFIYDPVGRLKQVTGKRSESLGFDAEGNVNQDQ